MLPDELAKTDTEHAHQRAFFQWINFASRYGFGAAHKICTGTAITRLYNCDATPLPELALMHAIPNGGYRRGSEASKLKAEGVKAGVLDTFLPVPKPFKFPDPDTGQDGFGMYAGLYVEFKEPKRRNHTEGGMSDTQIEFAEAVRHQGYCARVAYTWREAANVVMLYYGVDTRFEAA
jgi:hypothetical protein